MDLRLLYSTLSRSSRENYCAETIPQLLVNAKDAGCLGGDFNCITSKEDATKNPEAKISPSLKRLIKTFSWQDSFRGIYPTEKIFSRYYDSERFGEGATRIDRSCHYGSLIVSDAKYISLAFSDHMALIVSLKLPDNLTKIISPKSCPLFKIKPDVVQDKLFKARLEESMKALGVPVLNW